MVTLRIAGSHACFPRRDFSNDRVTYDVITPLAARAVLGAIHWTPSIRWHVRSIRVLNPIRLEWCVAGGGERMLCLRDVAYVIRARFELTGEATPSDNAASHASIFNRRASGLRFFRQPCLGHVGLPAEIALMPSDDEIDGYYANDGAIDLGWMVFDRIAADECDPRLYRPIMTAGEIDLDAIDPRALPS